MVLPQAGVRQHTPRPSGPLPRYGAPEALQTKPGTERYLLRRHYGVRSTDYWYGATRMRR